MLRFSLHLQNPEKRLMLKTAEVFKEGGLVVYPTEAGYSVGCSVYSKKAITRLYHLKRAIAKYTMAIMVSDFSQITDFANLETPVFRYIKGKLPGPYTFILPATNQGKKILDVRRPEVGIRMPKHIFFETLSQYYHDPIINTAARIREDEFFVNPDNIESAFGAQVDLIVDMGKVPLNPTTVISLVNGVPELIRQGAGKF